MKPSPWKWDAGLNAYSLSLDSTADYLSAGEFKRGEDHQEKCSETGSFDFTETNSYGAAERLLRDGWPEGAEQASKLVAKLAFAVAEANVAERHVTYYDVAGEEADVGRYLAGEPENMLDFRMEEVPAFGRVAQVVFDGCVSGGVDAKRLMQAAVIVSALIDSIELAGVRCEFVVRYRHCGVCEDGRKDCELEHIVKKANQPLDLPKVVAAMHPSAFRRIAFRWIECLNGIDGGYGSVGTSKRNAEKGSVALQMNGLTPLLGDEAAIEKWMNYQRERLLA